VKHPSFPSLPVLLLGAAAALVALAPAPTRAQAGGVVVDRFGGRRGAALRRTVVEALEAGGVEVIPLERAADEARGRGLEAGEPEVLRALGARAHLEGRVVRARRRWGAVVRVRDASGREVLTERLAARRAGALAARVRRWAEGDLVDALAALEAPPPQPAAPAEPSAADAPAEPPAPEAVAPAPDAPESSGEAERVPPFAVHAGIAVTHRAFTYNDDLFGRLRPYELPAAPVASLELEYFPGSHFDAGAFGGFSVTVAGEYAIGVQSVADNGTVFPTDLWALGAGVRYRLRVDDVVFRVDGGYQANVFAIHDANELSPRPEIPNLELHSLRAGAGLRWDVGLGLFFHTYGAYLHPLTTGEIASEDWFPRLDAGGVEAEAGIGFAVDDVELRALFTMRRFFYAMNPEPGDARVVGGAVDQYLSGALRFTYRPSGL
jgi:hypothetical protein